MEEFRIQLCDIKIDDPIDTDWQWVTQDDRPFTCLSANAAFAERRARQFYTDGVQFRIVSRTVSKWEVH